MMKKIKKYMMLLAVALPLSAMAQVLCTFETQDYDSLKVYDTWADSPFNHGKLVGNAEVVANTLKNDDNNSEKIVAFQRSRYAGGIYGAKIRLKTSFELTTNTKYVHVMLHKPVEGRAMLVGLGKRNNWDGQSDQVIQFYSSSISKSKTGEWFDAVFPVRGNGGIMISTVIVVPDCESPHHLTADYLTYIDNIEITSESTSRFGAGDYPINIGVTDVLKRDDRHVDGVSFTGDKNGSLTATVPTTADKLVYHDMTNTVTGFAVPGEKLTPNMSYTGNWMHGYMYLDFNSDGKFATDLSDNGSPATGSDVVAYSAYSLTRDEKNWANSTGASTSNNPGVKPPAFTLPADMQPGIYRLRYKVDWDNMDSGGNISTGNPIIGNGGGIVDVLLNVHKATSHVKIATRNGDVLKADGAIFEESDVTFGQPITIELKPEAGFKQNGVTIKHGYGLEGEEFVHSNRQWRMETIPASAFANNKYTIPAEYVDGDMLITAEFAENGGAAIPNVSADQLSISTSQRTLHVSAKIPTTVYVFDAAGKHYFSGIIDGERKFNLQQGVYFVNRTKVIVP